MDRMLTVFIYIWVGLFIVLNVVGIAGQFYLHGFSEGISYVRETYSPFNVINFLVTVTVLAPAIGAYLWREKRRETQSKREGRTA